MASDPSGASGASEGASRLVSAEASETGEPDDDWAHDAARARAVADSRTEDGVRPMRIKVSTARFVLPCKGALALGPACQEFEVRSCSIPGIQFAVIEIDGSTIVNEVPSVKNMMR